MCLTRHEEESPELSADPDEGLTIRKSLHDRLLRQKEAIARGECGELLDDILKEPFVLDDGGCVAVPQGPGLRVELDDEGLKRVMAHPWEMRRG